jgi:hypothetical protein
MARKRAPGGGRKPRGPYTGKSEVLTTRITPDTRIELERAAKRKKISLSQQVELILRTWIERTDFENKANRGLARATGVLAESVERATGNSWREDAFTSQALIAAIQFLVRYFAPTADPNPAVPSAVKDLAAKMPPEFAERYITFTGLGQSEAFMLITEIAHDPRHRGGVNEWTLPVGLRYPASTPEAMRQLHDDLVASTRQE